MPFVEARHTSPSAPLIERVRPIHAGWYAGDDVWDSCYGPSMHLTHDSRRFDVSPVWLSWVGAVSALEVMRLVPTAIIGDQTSLWPTRGVPGSVGRGFVAPSYL